ncbi:hypothetical protein C8R44DRAFT_783622 [Mycena epipterygia]|nr:hypothetical protein C8R44DRAFT_783622 [Mycena epipterygia]
MSYVGLWSRLYYAYTNFLLGLARFFSSSQTGFHFSVAGALIGYIQGLISVYPRAYSS